jgi:hypothetical protein
MLTNTAKASHHRQEAAYFPTITNHSGDNTAGHNNSEAQQEPDTLYNTTITE